MCCVNHLLTYLLTCLFIYACRRLNCFCTRYRATFERELQVTSRLCDVNVARLLGACLTEEPRYVIVEFPRHGDLAQYLRHHSPGFPAPGDDDDAEDQLLLMTSRRRRLNGTSPAVLRCAAPTQESFVCLMRYFLIIIRE